MVLTAWHGIFDNDGFGRTFLRDLAASTGRSFVGARDVSFADVRQRRFDLLADLVAEHLDTVAIRRLLADGVPAGLPTITSTLA